MDAAAMTYTYVGRVYDLALSQGSAKWKVRIHCTNPNIDVFVRLKTTNTYILNQLTTLQDGALIEVSATPSPASAPGEPYTVTRLTVLSTTSAEP
jgi:hypothetical protein